MTLDQFSRNVRRDSFHFEAWWVREDSFEEIVKDLLEVSRGNIHEKLKFLGEGLTRWGVNICKKRKRIKKMLS